MGRLQGMRLTPNTVGHMEPRGTLITVASPPQQRWHKVEGTRCCWWQFWLRQQQCSNTPPARRHVTASLGILRCLRLLRNDIRIRAT